MTCRVARSSRARVGETIDAMSGPLTPRDECIDAAAARWTALVEDGEMTANQHRELEAWLEADEAHRRSFTRYQYVSLDAAEKLAALADRLPEVAELRRADSGRSGFAWAWRWLAPLAAVVALALVALPVRRVADRSGTVADVATLAAERRSLTLADGTRAELNARTRVATDFRAELRRVRMDSGEAIFAVEKDPDRPFVIETPLGSIRVTGTVFNVRLAPTGALEVTVIEGSVAVTARPDSPASGGAVNLQRGEQILVSHDDAQVRTLAATDLEYVVAWKEGRIVFDAAPLEEVVARLAEFHGKTIDVAPEVSARRLGGSYTLDSLSGFFGALEDALPVRVVARADGSYLVSAKR